MGGTEVRWLAGGSTRTTVTTCERSLGNEDDGTSPLKVSPYTLSLNLGFVSRLQRSICVSTPRSDGPVFSVPPPVNLPRVPGG